MVEIFSEFLNGWIVLNLKQFNTLLQKANYLNEKNEFQFNQLNSSHLKYRVVENETNTYEQVDIENGDYIEINNKMYLEINLNTTDKTLNVKISDDNTTNENLYTVWTRQKVVYNFTTTNEAVIQTQNNGLSKKVNYSDIRLLSDSNYDNLSEFTLKYIDSANVLSFLSINDVESREINIEKIFKEINTMVNLDNIYFYLSPNSIILLGEDKNLNLITNLIYLKVKEAATCQKIQDKINLANKNMTEINKVLEESNKVIFVLPKKFINSIKSKILDFIISHDSHISYMLIDKDASIKEDSVQVILYGKGSMDKYEKYFKLQEGSMEVEPKICNWLKSFGNLEKLNKMVENSKIVIFLNF